eukprot:SAG31_NODE_1769_length_7312_cov_9.295577_3_plen_400_part_00
MNEQKVVAGRDCQYHIEQTIGGGTSANVFRGVNCATGQEVAVKAIDRSVLQSSERKLQLLHRELHIAGRLKHPNIINLIEVIFTERQVLLIMDLACGGELYDAVKAGPMPEARAQWVFQQILSAMHYCHSSGVCHRDLKLENLMVDVVDGSELIKITDFGLSKDSHQHSSPHTKVGTISYMAPEVTNANNSEPYDGPAADIWSMGCILYVLVCCKYPFGYDGPASVGGEPTAVVYSRIRAGHYSPFPSFLSDGCKDLIRRMLDTNPQERATIQQISAHPWMQAGPSYQPVTLSYPDLPALDEVEIWTNASSTGMPCTGIRALSVDGTAHMNDEDMNDEDMNDSDNSSERIPGDYSSFDFGMSPTLTSDLPTASIDSFGLKSAGAGSMESMQSLPSVDGI